MKTSRLDEIINILEVEVSVETQRLAEIFDVSTMTIRRDLVALEKRGLITLVHGGAMINSFPIISNKQHSEKMINEKRLIAKRAIEFVKRGDVILVDAGSTTKEFAMELRKVQDITVLTNSILVLNVLAQSDGKRRVINLPGTFSRQSMAIFGGLTNNFIRNFKVDRVFIGTMGISNKEGCTVSDIEEGITKSEFMKIADEVIILADKSKLGLSYVYQIDIHRKPDYIITNKSEEIHLINEFEEYKTKIIQI